MFHSIFVRVQLVGENKFEISPVVGGHFTHAGCSYQSVYGFVTSKWEVVSNTIKYHFSIPSNTKAIIILPNATYLVGTGEYDYVVEKK